MPQFLSNMYLWFRALFSRPSVSVPVPVVPFKTQVEELEKRYVDLVCSWTIFKDLYFDGKWQAVLEPIGAETFHEIARSLTEHIILQLCRLTDTVKYSGELPLSLKRLYQGAVSYADSNEINGKLEYEADTVTPKVFSRQQKYATFRQEIEVAFDKLRPISKKLHVHRNKKIAHHDYRAAFDPAAHVLPNVTYSELGGAVGDVGIFLQTINSHLWGIGVSYNYPYSKKPGELVDILAQALERQIRPRRR